MSIPGFEQYRRIWDAGESCNTIKILPGEFYVTREQERVETVLGSCIAACIRDPIAGIGGMNHFMLPIDKNSSNSMGDMKITDANRYGNFAMENLINTILKNGGKRQNLEVKVFGGGRIMNQMTNIGWYNIGFVLDYLNTEGFDIVSQDIGDIFPRKVLYYPASGRVKVRRLNALHSEKLVQQETRYQNTVSSDVGSSASDDIELFD